MLARIGNVIYWYCIFGAVCIIFFAAYNGISGHIHDYYDKPEPSISDFNTVDSYKNAVIEWAKEEQHKEDRDSSNKEGIFFFAIGLSLFGRSMKYIFSGE